MAQPKSSLVASIWEQAFSPDEQARWEALSSLAATKSSDADRALMELYKYSPYLSEKIEILEALTTHLTPRRLCFLFSLVRSTSPEIRLWLLKKLSTPTGPWIKERRAFFALEKNPSSSWILAFLEIGALLDHFEVFQNWLTSQSSKDLWLQRARPWLDEAKQQALERIPETPIELKLWSSQTPLKDLETLASIEPWKALRLAAEMRLTGEPVNALMQEAKKEESTESINALLYSLSISPQREWNAYLTSLDLEIWGLKVLKAWSGSFSASLFAWASTTLQKKDLSFSEKIEIFMTLLSDRGPKPFVFSPSWPSELKDWLPKQNTVPLAAPQPEALDLEHTLSGLKREDTVTMLFLAHRALEQAFLKHWEPLLQHALKQHFHAVRSRLYALGLNQAFPPVALLKKAFPDGDVVPLTKIVQISQLILNPPLTKHALSGLKAFVALSYLFDALEPRFSLSLKQKKQLMHLQEERNTVIHAFKVPTQKEAGAYLEKVKLFLKSFNDT